MSFLKNVIAGKRRIWPSHLEKLIRAETQQWEQKPSKRIIDASWGDAHRMGIKPISFVRQVTAACLYPELLHSERLPVDVQMRAQRFLKQCDGGSVGAYTVPCGVAHVKRNVSDFILRRDGGIPSNPDNIFICNGSQSALMVILKLLSYGKGLSQTGILAPLPNYSSFNLMLATQGTVMVPYHLCEEEGWCLKVEELRRVLHAARSHCSPRALYVINPGNPTGHIQSRESIEDVIRFAAEEKLFLLADEVYQDIVHMEGCEFISYKKVLFEMGPEYSDTVEMASFHSISKGFMGECGLRGGYMELLNVNPAVMQLTHTLISTMSCSSVMGQIALDILADPPQVGDPSYPTYSEEVLCRRNMLAWNIRLAQDVLGGLPGVICQPVMGGIYVYPRLHLPSRAVEQAKVS
ncbi:alanine aminotransferase 2-like [Conger conger]|uniref:alanine aminotransferase 2-like n=1 Tax=Conger conger TaxID=82655 RepID=UPI002A5A65B2|nr:alanine aminotransferase 2-like [Conger conger]